MPGTANLTWGTLYGSEVRFIDCIHQFKVDHMKDPLKEHNSNNFDGGFKTVLVGKDLARDGKMTSVLVNVPLDTTMSFKLSAGATQDDKMVWFEGPIANFRSTKELGCGGYDIVRGFGLSEEGMPSFQQIDETGSQFVSLDELVTMSMDEDGEKVFVDWSELNVTNQECLNGFVVQYNWMCETCDPNFGGGTVVVPPNETKLELQLEEGRFQVSDR